MAKPAIALYLGESYATIGLFDTSHKLPTAALFEKSIFLPQVSLKNLLNQTKIKVKELFTECDEIVPVYIVTKYFDRLKQFRLGGSISQIILKGFENSYTLSDSKLLSLAAAQLIIPLDSTDINEDFLNLEITRIKKINPDLNKVVISIPEESISSAQMEFLHNFFTSAGLKIFTCTSAHNQSQLRKTLLNAGSEGTKEEIVSEIKEAFGEQSPIHFFCKDGFQLQFENCELFTSANNFLAHYIKSLNFSNGAFFDLEALKFINTKKVNDWQSPWGTMPIEHYDFCDFSFHPFSEVKINQMSMLQIENSLQQLEPGPVVAGRAIRPLLIDLFQNELQSNELAMNLFPQLTQENLKQKIFNLFSVMEKGQKIPSLSIKISDLKKNILDTLYSEIRLNSTDGETLIFGPLADIFIPGDIPNRVNNFSWTNEIIKYANRLNAK